jgi:hypothetical protein
MLFLKSWLSMLRKCLGKVWSWEINYRFSHGHACSSVVTDKINLALTVAVQRGNDPLEHHLHRHLDVAFNVDYRCYRAKTCRVDRGIVVT